MRIVQTPGWVAILPDGLQYPQLLALDGREHVSPKIRGWFGNSRARWEGDQLVIETTNFNDSRTAAPSCRRAGRSRSSWVRERRCAAWKPTSAWAPTSWRTV